MYLLWWGTVCRVGVVCDMSERADSRAAEWLRTTYNQLWQLEFLLVSAGINGLCVRVCVCATRGCEGWGISHTAMHVFIAPM